MNRKPIFFKLIFVVVNDFADNSDGFRSIKW